MAYLFHLDSKKRMLPGKNKQKTTEKDIQQDQQEIDEKVPNENVKAALEQAQEDIQQDPEFSAGNPNDDLDEGESARLGEDRMI